MNRNRLVTILAMLVMSCLLFGQARDPKTGKFVKSKSTMSKSHGKMSKSAFNKMHPRDASGKFIKKSTGHSLPPRNAKGQFMKMHGDAGHPAKMGKGKMMHMGAMGMPHKMAMHNKMSVKGPKMKSGMMSKMKAMFHKKPKKS